MPTDWNGGPLRWRASNRMLMHGPRIVKVCRTKLGARFAAWCRRGEEAGQP